MAEGENATTSRKLKHSWQIHEENRKLRPQSMTADLPAKMGPQRRRKIPIDFDPGLTA
jgi:hypothetical protein